MIEVAAKTGTLPAPAAVVWESLTDPHRRGARPWLNLLPDEVEPTIVAADEPTRLVWSSIWPGRPNDQVRFELRPAGDETAVSVSLLSTDTPPDESQVAHLRKRLSHLLFADLRFSYGQ